MSQYEETKLCLSLASKLPGDPRHRQTLLYAKAAIEDLEAKNAELTHLVGFYEQTLADRLNHLEDAGMVIEEIRGTLKLVTDNTRKVA